MSLKSILRLFLALGLCAALPLTLSACAMDDEAADANPPPQNVQENPPMIQAEVIPVIWDPQAEIWRPGYWAMSDGQYVWVPGRVMTRPSPTAVWATPHWAHHTFGWSFEEGHWE